MAADQLNKRSKVRNVIRHTSWELQKTKKKKVSHHDLNMRASISLEWDAKKELVVPKKEQISIARRELTPYLSVLPQCQNALGDVFEAPPELFERDNLTGLLSYEVWQTHLSLQEREFLTGFLPEGADPHKIVHELLGGNNFYFGNPFPKWVASVCSGNCHPDAVLRQEQCNKANKIAYYSELHKYHTKMIGSLQLWKERWASCVNSENDFVQKIQRPRKDFHKNSSSHENGPEDDLGATSDSCSWDADDRSYSSDSPNVENKNGETIMRVSRMDMENKYYTRPRKGDKLHKLNIECGDGAKYMSYIKVSKEQHERVKSSMKHSNMSIQPRSLNHVLGNLDSFCVQPYVVFEEEERQKLHDHWLHLAKKDLPAGFENWKGLQSAKLELTKSLRKEIEDKTKSNLYHHHEEIEESQILILDANLDNGVVAATKVQDEEQQQLVGALHHDAETDVLLIAEETVERNDESVFRSDPDLNETGMEMEHSDESSEDSARNHHLPPITIHNGSQNFCPITIDSNHNVLTDPDPFPSNLHEYTQPQHFPQPSATSELWTAASLPSSYYHQPPPVTVNGYTSIGELSLRQRRSDGGDSFFYPYANQDRNELLLHSLYKDPASSYLHEQKLSRLGFHPTGNDPIPGNLCSNIQENAFSDQGGRFSIPRQEHLLPLHDWPVNGMPMAPASSHQNWFPDDEVVPVPVRDGWSGNHDIGNSCVMGDPVADESLFSVLSQCNGLRSGSHFGSTEQFIQSGNYGGMGGRPTGRGAAGVGYMGGNEGQSGWMNLPRVLRDPGGKSFPRPWNANELG